MFKGMMATIAPPIAIPFTLDDLYVEAMAFGMVTLSQIKAKHFYAKITFETTPGISLEAGHKGFVETPHEALRLAIENAKEIRRAFK